MKLTIKTEAIEFVFEDENLKSNTFYSDKLFQDSIDYIKQLIEKVSIESQNINNPQTQV